MKCNECGQSSIGQENTHCTHYEEAVKKCPFCNGEAEVCDTTVSTLDGQKKWSVQCLECGVILDRETKSDALKAWNNRV